MNILVISDTHGDISLVERYNQSNSTIDAIIHLGDYYSDGTRIAQQMDLPIYQVKGNCDVQLADEELVIDLGGVRFLICHGHKYNVKWGINGLYYRSLEVGAQVILFGHSHQQLFMEEDGMTFINPGSASQPRDDQPPSMGIITIKDKKMTGYEIIC